MNNAYPVLLNGNISYISQNLLQNLEPLGIGSVGSVHPVYSQNMNQHQCINTQQYVSTSIPYSHPILSTQHPFPCSINTIHVPSQSSNNLNLNHEIQLSQIQNTQRSHFYQLQQNHNHQSQQSIASQIIVVNIPTNTKITSYPNLSSPCSNSTPSTLSIHSNLTSMNSIQTKLAQHRFPLFLIYLYIIY